MKKIIAVVLLAITLLPQSLFAQKIIHNKQMEKQVRSMEIGPWDFSPGGYYYLFHKDYSGAYLKWKWRGLKSGHYVYYKESKSNTKRVLPRRVASTLLQKKTLKDVNVEHDDTKAMAAEEALRSADRNVDLVYLEFSGDFRQLKDKITSGLHFISQKSKGKMQVQLKQLQNDFDFLCERINYIHKQGKGYELENSSREDAYLDIRTKLQNLCKEVNRNCMLASNY